MVTTLVARNSDEAMMEFVGVCIWRKSEVRRFCVGAFGSNLALVSVKMFLHLIYLLKKFYTYCSFSATFEVIVAINAGIFQTRNV
jgi:hypothetical protein